MMESFDSSVIWLVALGKTLVHSIWIGLLILAILRVVLHQIPMKFSNLRYSLSVFAMLTLLCSVVVAFSLIYIPITTIGEGNASGMLVNRSESLAGISVHQIYRIFGQIYFAGTLVTLIRSSVSLGYVRRLRKNGTPISTEWQHRLSQISKSLGIWRSVRLFESTQIKSPLLIGYLKPAIIIPAGMITNLPVNQIETILMHELYHIKRMDYLVNIMQLFIEGVLFYHPAVWIISGIVRMERENCCDDGVLKEINNPVSYAKALIHIAEQQQAIRLAPGAAGSSANHLKFRINRILNLDHMKTNIRDRAVSLALLAGAVILMTAATGFIPGPSQIQFTSMTSELETVTTADTIPQKNMEIEKTELLEEIEEIHWEEMKQEIESARREVLEEIEEIDWEEMKAEIESARREALKEIEEIDWEEMRLEMERTVSEMKIDFEQMKIDIVNSIDEIDLEEIRNELKNQMFFPDSLHIELNH